LRGKNSWCLASEACLNAKQLFTQINYRFDRLSKVKNKDLHDFLVFTFKPLFIKVWANSERNWPSDNLEKDLPKSMQVFSPSDFGFHNAILKDDGELKFIDFEYFGRDDPVKLVADFIWHPGMELNTSQKIKWLKGAISIFDKDPELYSRFNAAWPLYGLRWSLILLNEFIQDGWQRRVYANRNIKHHHEKKLAGQIIKAKSLCEQIQLANLKCPYV
jgi:thiamine kinase-like enzyme